MTLLTAVMTHLDAGSVERQLAYLNALSPASRFVICHGGPRAEFDRLRVHDALYIEDPSLRARDWDHSHNEVFERIYERYVRDDGEVELVYFIEYDQLILSPDFERRLEELAHRSGAGLLAKAASPRNDTNWSHYLRARDDGRLNDFIAALSTRDDPGVRWGCLGTGMLFRRDALAALCSIANPPHAYVELYAPSVVYHLGFDVADVDALGDLYASVRWRPEWSPAETLREKRAGRAFVHPFKALDALPRIAAAPPNGGLTTNRERDAGASRR